MDGRTQAGSACLRQERFCHGTRADQERLDVEPIDD
jgi:hypothetical protein